jgi:hypothetical protein
MSGRRTLTPPGLHSGSEYSRSGRARYLRSAARTVPHAPRHAAASGRHVRHPQSDLSVSATTRRRGAELREVGGGAIERTATRHAARSGLAGNSPVGVVGDRSSAGASNIVRSARPARLSSVVPSTRAISSRRTAPSVSGQSAGASAGESAPSRGVRGATTRPPGEDRRAGGGAGDVVVMRGTDRADQDRRTDPDTGEEKLARPSTGQDPPEPRSHHGVERLTAPALLGRDGSGRGGAREPANEPLPT